MPVAALDCRARPRVRDRLDLNGKDQQACVCEFGQLIGGQGVIGGSPALMRWLMNRLNLLAIPLMAMSLSALAQNAPPPSGGYDAGPAPGGEPRRVRFVDADTDHDGRLSRAEAQAMPFVARHFDAIDTDHDGYVTRTEMRAEHARIQAARARRGGNPRNGNPSYTSPPPDQSDEGMN